MTFVRTNLADLNKPIPERREREGACQVLYEEAVGM